MLVHPNYSFDICIKTCMKQSCVSGLFPRGCKNNCMRDFEASYSYYYLLFLTGIK